MGVHEARADAEPLALYEAGRQVLDQVVTYTDSLLTARGAGLPRDEIQTYVTGMVEVKAGRIREDRRAGVIQAEAACNVDPEVLTRRMGELRRDPSIRQELASTHAELERLRTLLNEQSRACVQAETPGDWRRLAGQRRESLTKLDVQGLLLRARVASLNPDASGRQEALRSVARALKRDARSAEAHMYMGILLHEGGDLDGAIAEYRQVLRIKPDEVNAHHNLAVALKDKGDLDGMIEQYRQILQINPKDVDACYNLGTALRLKGDLDGAIVQYRQVLRIDPRHVLARSNLGTALHIQGDLDGAIVQYRQVLKIDSNDVSARYNLGTALKDRGDVDRAIVELQKVLQLNPNYADAHYNLGAALAAKGDRPGALREMRDCIRLSNDEGRKEEAREVIRAMGGAP